MEISLCSLSEFPPETYDVLVTRNRVHDGYSHEGIGLYTGVNDIIVEHNVIWDVGTYHIYKSDAYIGDRPSAAPSSAVGHIA